MTLGFLFLIFFLGGVGVTLVFQVGFEDYGPDCDSMRITAFLDIPGQDNLTPLARLEKYAFSDNIFNR